MNLLVHICSNGVKQFVGGILWMRRHKTNGEIAGNSIHSAEQFGKVDAVALPFAVRIDVLTGAASLEVKLNTNIVNRVEAQVGVPIALSQVTRNYIGAANEILGAVGNIAKGVGSIASGKGGGIIDSVVGAGQGIINGYAALQPRANTIGSGGGFGHLQGSCELDYQFFSAVDDDLTNNGRPLCKMQKPEDIPGFMIIQDGYFEGAATFAEAEEIRSLLESGFYWE